MSFKTSRLPLRKRIRKNLNDSFMRSSIGNAQDLLNQKRQDRFAELGDYEQWRELAADIRQHVLDHLDYYLNQFIQNAQQAGAHVHCAENGAEANAVAIDLFKEKQATIAVKSKSMVTEEIGLNEALNAVGVEIFETDLGEYLLQIDDNDKPSHIVVPALHKSRSRIRDILARKTNYQGDDAPENMTRHVRQVLRKIFLKAQIGITGCNFGVAENGAVVLVTNEGNGRFVTTLPQTQIVFMGIERIIPTLQDLDIMLSMLARSAVGARATVYTSILTGPRKPREVDGPEEMHIILVDNGRSRVLGSPFRSLLRCIRCGTCMLECPAYRHISGHGYGTLYPGPLGAALMPALGGYEEYKDVTKICSLCGACNDVCPVKIPLYETIFEHRRVIAEDLGKTPLVEDIAFSQYANVIGSSKLFNLVSKMAYLGNLAPKVGPLAAWSAERQVPKIAKQWFRDWYAKRSKEREG